MMRHPRRTRAVICLTLILLFLLVTVGALAASNGFFIPWWTVDSGGGSSQGGEYAVSGTIGQPDTNSLMSGGDYTVVGGFWGGAMTPPNPKMVYLPLVIR
jgi:hypothetical protein